MSATTRYQVETLVSKNEYYLNKNNNENKQTIK